MSAITKTELFAAVDAGDLGVIEGFFQQPHVRTHVADVNARCACFRAEGHEVQWTTDLLDTWCVLPGSDGDDNDASGTGPLLLFERALAAEHVHVLVWFFSPAVADWLLETLLVIVDFLALAALDAPTDLALEAFELMLDSDVCAHMDDDERELLLLAMMSAATGPELRDLIAAHGGHWNGDKFGHGGALDCAIEKGHLAAIDDLVRRHGVTIVGSDLLPTAVDAGNVDVVAAVLELGCAIEYNYTRHPPPLQCVAQMGWVDMASILLARGFVDVDSRDAGLRTPLIAASFKADFGEADDEDMARMVELLLSYGADVLAQDGDLQTALHYACHSGLMGVAEVLLEAGADVNAINVLGETPMHIAYGSDDADVELIELLTAYGADLGIENNNGSTPHDILYGQTWGSVFG